MRNLLPARDRPGTADVDSTGRYPSSFVIVLAKSRNSAMKFDSAAAFALRRTHKCLKHRSPEGAGPFPLAPDVHDTTQFRRPAKSFKICRSETVAERNQHQRLRPHTRNLLTASPLRQLTHPAPRLDECRRQCHMCLPKFHQTDSWHPDRLSRCCWH